MSKSEQKMREALASQDSLNKLSSAIKGNILEFCKELSRFRQNKYYLILGDFNTFEDYCSWKLNMSRSSADRHALVGQFLRDFQPSDFDDSKLVSLDNFENLSICKLYLLASSYFRNHDLFEKICTLDVVNMKYKDLCKEVLVWESMLVVKKDVEFKGDVQELRDTIETVANEIQQDKFTATAGNTKQYDENVRTYINSVMNLRAECERVFRFLDSNSGSDLFGNCCLYGILEEFMQSCDDDLNTFMG